MLLTSPRPKPAAIHFMSLILMTWKVELGCKTRSRECNLSNWECKATREKNFPCYFKLRSWRKLQNILLLKKISTGFLKTSATGEYRWPPVAKLSPHFCFVQECSLELLDWITVFLTCCPQEAASEINPSLVLFFFTHKNSMHRTETKTLGVGRVDYFRT